jgi:hypothetical protein
VEKTTYRGALWSVLLIKYYWGDQIKKSEMGGACGAYGERRGACRVLMGKPEGMRKLGRPRCRWEDNIKLDLQEV